MLEFKQTAQKKLEEHSENKNMEKQQVKQEQFDPRKFISQIKLRESVEKKLDKIIAPKQQPAINDIRVQTNWLSSRQKKTGK